MCGIVAITGRAEVTPALLDGLRALDYRGYDSAGIAVAHGNALTVRRRAGRVADLAGLLRQAPAPGSTGIAHTRWATHGRVSDDNAHPHATDRVALVHNGIIENHLDLRRSLEADGRRFASETDSECILHLVDAALADGLAPLAAVRQALGRLQGAYALVFLFRDAPGLLIAARHGAPIAVGQAEGETRFASDPLALPASVGAVRHLQDGDIAIARGDGVEIRAGDGGRVERPPVAAAARTAPPELAGHAHHMAREIHEQPAALARLVAGSLDADRRRPLPLPPTGADLGAGIDLVGCGTALLAGRIGEYWIEAMAGIRARAEIASEFRYRPLPATGRSLTVLLSQSGETADTLAALDLCRRAGRVTLGIVNAPGSTLDRNTDFGLDILAGREISVASTKAFTSTLAALLHLAWSIAAERETATPESTAETAAALAGLPQLVAGTLDCEAGIRAAAALVAEAPLVLYLGRGPMHVLALEGALKLKEISYVHAEGFAAGELKHGPIALIDERVPVVVLAPPDGRFAKTIANMHEAMARGAPAILVSDERGIERAGEGCAATIALPACPDLVAPLVYAPVVQLLAYHAACRLGRDIDRPRNLAKSVTVE